MGDRKKISDIVRSFADNMMPEDVQYHFRRWIISRENYAEKSEALRNYWDSLEGVKSDKETYQDLSRIRREISAYEDIRKRSLVMKVAGIAAAAVILIAAQVLLYRYFTRPADDVYLLAAEDSKGAFVLPDGSKVWLNGGSSLRYSKDFIQDGRSVYLEGEAFFDVVKERKSFVVRTACLDVTVHGTRFNVDVRPENNYAEVVLQSGKVSLDGDSFPSPLVLSPGDRFHMSLTDHTADVKKVKTVNYSRWTGKEMVLFNEPLDDILVSMAHWYGVNIETRGHIDENIHLSMTVSTQSLEDMLKYISMISDIDYEMLDSGDVVIVPKSDKTGSY